MVGASSSSPAASSHEASPAEATAWFESIVRGRCEDLALSEKATNEMMITVRRIAMNADAIEAIEQVFGRKMNEQKTQG